MVVVYFCLTMRKRHYVTMTIRAVSKKNIIRLTLLGHMNVVRGLLVLFLSTPMAAFLVFLLILNRVVKIPFGALACIPPWPTGRRATHYIWLV